MNEFSLSIRVYIEDTDAGGIVYYANYLKFMERARTEFMRELGYGKPALFDGLQFVVRSLSVNYHNPSVLDDQIIVTAKLQKVTRVRFVMSQTITRHGILLADGHVEAACIDVTTKKPTPIPKLMFEKLTSQLG
jgi:4-hydroxybenzoyl-CoA thioesterase/acyl-CoA thioester hydrolase